MHNSASVQNANWLSDVAILFKLKEMAIFVT